MTVCFSGLHVLGARVYDMSTGQELCLQLQDVETHDVISVWLHVTQDNATWPVGLVRSHARAEHSD